MLPFVIAALALGIALVPLYGFFVSLYGGSAAAVQVGFVDNDGSDSSRALLAYCKDDLGYTVNAEQDTSALDGLLVNHNISVIITVPNGFEQGIVSGSDVAKVDVTYTQDYKNLAFVQSYLDQYTGSLRVLASGANGNISAYHSMLANMPAQSPQLSVQATDSTLGQEQSELSAYDNIMGFYGSFSFFILIALAFTVLDDRERGTYARMRLSNMNAVVYIAGLCAASIVLCAVMVAPLLIYFTVSGLGALFHVGALALICIPYALFCIGFAIIAGLFFKGLNAIIALIIGAGVILSMLGGLYWPIQYVPTAIQAIGHFTPQFWFSDAISQFMGVSSGAWPVNFLIIALFALLMFFIAGIRVATRRRKM
jgi:ABC-2 type transport system permease protein